MFEARGMPVYSSEDVCAMLDASVDTASIGSESENESDSDSESEFDLSNPEAGLSASDESEYFLSQTCEEPDQYFSSQDSTSCSGIRGQSTRCRSRSRKPRGAVRTRARGRGSRKSRSTAKSSTEEPKRPPLPVKDICNKTDVVKEDFTFAPDRPEGFFIPSEVDTSNPEELFKLFFNKDIVEYICKSSDEYAECHKDDKPVMYKYYDMMSTDDFYKLVAIFIHLGYKKIPKYCLAWNSSSLCYDPFIPKVLSRNKFEGLMTFLHVVDQQKESELRSNNDKLLKVRPLYEHINSSCRKYCQPSREISIDERMVRSKAHFSFKQYIKNKPTKWGFKLWCLCNTTNGYTVKFSIYRGKTGEVISGNGLSYDVVFRLMDEYLDQGYNLFVDNFYTSPTLAFDLFARKTHLTGTLDRSRKHVPSEVLDCYKKLSEKGKQRGEGLYVRDGCAVYSTWKDTKCITVLSTKYPGYSDTTVKRNTKDEQGHHQKSDVPIPSPVFHYNKHMGGVDKSDQLIHYYNVLRSSKKYWKTLFFHFIDIAVVNSYIIHQEKEKNPLSHYKFRENLVMSLSGIIPESPRYTKSYLADKPVLSSHCSLLEHYPVMLTQRAQCVYCKVIDQATHFTTRKCRKCKIPLCFIDRDCFLKWHDPSFDAAKKDWLKRTVIAKSPKRGRPPGSTKTKGKGKRKRKRW